MDLIKINVSVLVILATLLVTSCGDSEKINTNELSILLESSMLMNEMQSKGLSGSKEELQHFVDVFSVCNNKIYTQIPRSEHYSRIAIQEMLYLFPVSQPKTNLDLGLFWTMAKKAKDNPALGIDISPIFKSLVTPTATQETIFNKDYLVFHKSTYPEFNEYLSRGNNIPLDKDKYSDYELKKQLVLGVVSLTCARSDVYLGLFDYTNVYGFETISREAAMGMLSNTRRKAISEVTKVFRSQ
tara:strand:- start:6274 stop:6999 length:726 start_codon:yes stop_codon:yes gene_type:complete